MAVEIKTMGAELTDAQKDTLHVWNQITRNRKQTATNAIKHQAGQTVTEVYSHVAKCEIILKAFGVHVLTFSGLGPDDSKSIQWDKKGITQEQLVGLLRFDVEPDNFTSMDEFLRLRHKAPMQHELPLLTSIGGGKAA
jgi:hypothetical protein